MSILKLQFHELSNRPTQILFNFAQITSMDYGYQ